MRLGCVFPCTGAHHLSGEASPQPLGIHWDVLQNGVYCAQLSSLPPILRVLDELGEERGRKMRGMGVCPGSRTVYG
jgi:hypothetical protein